MHMGYLARCLDLIQLGALKNNAFRVSRGQDFSVDLFPSFLGAHVEAELLVYR